MKFLTEKYIKAFSFGLSLAAICFLGMGLTQAHAQDNAPVADADHTITITKVVEVYKFEDMEVAVDQYTVAKGDSMFKILKERGLLNGRRDEAKLMRLIKELNPEVSDFNTLAPGQVVNVPSFMDEDTKLALTEGNAPDEKTILEISNIPASVTETVKVYKRPSQGDQQPATVVVMRHVPGAKEASTEIPAVQPAPAVETAPDPAETVTTETPTEPKVASGTEIITATDPAAASTSTLPAVAGTAETTAAGSGEMSFPSGNAGSLAMEPVTNIVYRTVKIRRGDSLERLLRREGMHRDLIYSHLLKVTMELNPEIKNPDLIQAGVELKIPAAGNYLTAMAGVNPDDVKNAAAAIAERRGLRGGGAGAGASIAVAIKQLPDAAAESSRNSLGLIFTRLGEKFEQSGQVSLTSGNRTFELDKAVFPMLELTDGQKVVLDTGSNLPQSAVRILRGQKPPIKVFRQSRQENLDRILGRLWTLCGYYRVYTKDRTYEGGEDLRLRISADWMVWPTQEAWNAGQPLIINRVTREGLRTDPAWVKFLEDHGIKVVDIYRNVVLPATETPVAAPAELTLTPVNDRNPTLFAAELVNSFGIEPKVGVQLDLNLRAGDSASQILTAPVLWETEKNKVVLDFGEMPTDSVALLRQNGYRVVITRPESPAVVAAVVEGFGFKFKENLTINAPTGGPKMSLVIRGVLVSATDGEYLITKAALPAGVAGFLDPKLKIVKY